MYPWAKQYLKNGSDAFSDKTKGVINSNASFYGDAVTKYLASLHKQASGVQGYDSDLSELASAARAAASVGNILSKMGSSTSSGKGTAAETTALENSLLLVGKVLGEIESRSLFGGSMVKEITKFDDASNITSAELVVAHKKSLKEIFAVKPTGWGMGKGGLGFSEEAKSLGEAALLTLLGPGYMIAKPLYQLGKGLFNWGAKKLLGRQGKLLSGVMGSFGSKYSAGLSGSGAFGAGAAPAAGQPPPAPGAPATGAGGSGRAELFAFFDGPAYQAKWTKEHIELMRIIAGTSPAKNAKSSTNIFGMGGGWLLSFIKNPYVIGAIVAAVAAYFTAKSQAEVAKVTGLAVSRGIHGGPSNVGLGLGDDLVQMWTGKKSLGDVVSENTPDWAKIRSGLGAVATATGKVADATQAGLVSAVEELRKAIAQSSTTKATQTDQAKRNVFSIDDPSLEAMQLSWMSPEDRDA